MSYPMVHWRSLDADAGGNGAWCAGRECDCDDFVRTQTHRVVPLTAVVLEPDNPQHIYALQSAFQRVVMSRLNELSQTSGGLLSGQMITDAERSTLGADGLQRVLAELADLLSAGGEGKG